VFKPVEDDIYTEVDGNNLSLGPLATPICVYQALTFDIPTRYRNIASIGTSVYSCHTFNSTGDLARTSIGIRSAQPILDFDILDLQVETI